MNYLKNKVAYLCGPIHDASDDGIGWRDFITPKLQKFDIIVSDPCKKTEKTSEVGTNKEKFKKLLLKEDFKLVKTGFWPIVRYDLRSVDKCDFIIFNYDTTAKMVGSIHELIVANTEKKVILLKYDKKQLNDFNPWLACLIKEHHFFATWDKLFKHLKDINDGKLDSSYWIL